MERHYKKGYSKSKILPMYFQIGKVIESASDFFTGRLTKKERKGTIAFEPSEVLSDLSLANYRNFNLHSPPQLEFGVLYCAA